MMELDEFVALVPNLAKLSYPDQVKHFVWYLHRFRANDRVDAASIRACYEAVAMKAPNISRELFRLYDRGDLLRVAEGEYRLERGERDALDKKYGEHQSTVVVKQLLLDLPGKIADDNEKTFLREALDCYKARAYRAATVMVWNLTYDHLLTYIMADAKRLADFNSGIAGHVGMRRAGTVIHKRDDFEDLKEREVLDIASKTNVISEGIKKVLVIGLDRRNLAAHPSGVHIAQPTADDMVYSLVTNVVIKLT